ncbi:DnaJ-domain-containing protein [Aspergillus steynii IBT 23096]|uniref:Diphthamide biosynthesis protein 4 n=1 Tax=Aspergillus steynii IBT 23096 TaxID=1392250 RepID=A0A2I2GP79_9EURO|nr:DnaJ-domain-containing protein [Aspergillus steynii IBT 23096]PLB54679.1 DnaJ-domain-containing protein [Aspergillus steynii IBT 23096]
MTHDHYEILSLPFSGSSPSLSKQQLKIAYHKALLKHHPDKASSDPSLQTESQSLPRSASNPSSDGAHTSYTIDQITTAYKTLSDPQLRAEYDRGLRLDRSKVAEREKTGTVFHTGLEVVDLEDLGCDEDAEQAVWYRGCRCGDDKGFLVTEDELEREAEHGEIVIGCRGCSLWMKILFAVDEDEGEEQKT